MLAQSSIVEPLIKISVASVWQKAVSVRPEYTARFEHSFQSAIDCFDVTVVSFRKACVNSIGLVC